MGFLELWFSSAVTIGRSVGVSVAMASEMDWRGQTLSVVSKAPSDSDGLVKLLSPIRPLGMFRQVELGLK